ncbi:hypothetical protein RN001_007750 [Aquatica leii]|uniref:DUF659 domain-containing protein n=1 Tax=Aquatica leii TaxID=1421715 RepID=A0AAN7PWS4_9COLE|nr:hypothetical protein RN001_007750 [Aquatica leii]
MVKAAKTLKILYPNLVHVTCIAHALNKHQDVFRHTKNNAGTPLPPEPVVTRCGTWLETAKFYANNFESFKTVSNLLDDDALSAKHLKTLLVKPTVLSQLAFVDAHFDFLKPTITNSKCNGRLFSDSVELVNKVKV